ncbi:Protein phosphatase 1 regulatory subunit 37 [Triplophysa tibetana]|uniref:Protein phosphatase 1 regulatory subunit 37 n=1 Tax=Triplophysa tibetana TaxID=1572043 RepID=A0A5A9NYA3_9TELE|nr:Protein phosphatase 1 regulatory subunit 37 [Triplophysa tibetana]
MNCEDQAVDSCNAMTKPDVYDNTTSHTVDKILPCDGLSDGENEERGATTEAADSAVLARLKDVHAKDEDIKLSTDIKAIHSKNNGSIASAAVSADPVNGSSDEQQKLSSDVEESLVTKCSLGDGGDDDDGDMDIGVDLSLDENGVLELQPADQTTAVSEGSASSCDNVLVSETVIVLHSEESSEDVSSLSPCVEAISPASTSGEGTGVKHGSKRVTFPSDEDIISGAVEPKDPFRHAKNVTVEEILNAYRQACQKLNCKPIPKVLKQIQDLKDLTQRNECLDLKGEKLDYKSCESLEEILKRVQFRVVDLEQTNLDEDGASALFDMIEYYESATHLNISFNKHMGTRGWQAAAHMMRKTSSLQYLDARNTPLLDHSAPFVARALRISSSLTVLHLENAGLSGRPLMLLATALKMNMNLRELYLADNKLNGLQDSAQLGNLLKFNYNIQILDLRNNHILDSGMAYVCEGLKEQRKGLVTLVLWNNQLTHNGMSYMAAALSLETLNLGHNAVGNEGVHKLKDGLIANRSILRLGLASTKVSCEGAVAIAEFIAESPRLLRLDLRENEIKTGGLMALSLAFKVNTSLLRLDLDREPKKETVKSFLETQRALLADIQNGCKRNFILAKEKEETEQKMRESVSMAEIATEDQTHEEEDEETPASAETDNDENSDSQGEKTDEADEERSSENQEDEDEKQTVEDDSDSDTEDEDVAEEPVVSPHATPPIQIRNSAASPHTCMIMPPTPPPLASPVVISGIKVTEATVGTGTPPSPGRCFSVSSPGRGHKIFMVTRVESPPEQKQFTVLPKVIQERAAESQTPGAPKQTDTTAPLDAPSKLPEQKSTDSPASLNGTQITEMVEPLQIQSEVKSQSPQTAQTAESEPPDEPPSEPLGHNDTISTPSPAADKCENVTEQINSDEVSPEASISESSPTPNGSPTPQHPLEKQTDSVDQSHIEQFAINTNTQRLHEIQNVIKQDQTAPSVKEEERSSERPVQESSPSQTEPFVSGQSQVGCITQANAESPSGSPDGRCTREESLPTLTTGAALPNGLKPEFAFHLLEPEGPKPTSCIMEHGAMTKISALLGGSAHTCMLVLTFAFLEEALMFCNPEVLNPDQSSRDCSSICSELQNHNVSKSVAELSQAQIHNSSVCESTPKVLQSTEELPEEQAYSTVTDPTIPSYDPTVPPPVRSRFRRHFITVTQDLLCSALILVNGLVVLLMKPHCHRPHSDCHLLVYLDASFSILVIVVLLATALPKLYRYGLLVLQATPLHLCINEVRDSLTHVPGVLTVHELHVWQLSETYVVASVHVHCPEKLNAEECSDLMEKITGVLKAFGINHCTVQPEFLPSERRYAVNSGGDGPAAPVSLGCSLRCGEECAEKLCCSSQKNLRSIRPQEESFSPPASSSVGTTTDVVIENTYL